jgi:vacuolar-type H+-ATPase subunit H
MGLENVLKSLKKAEEFAQQIEDEAKEKSLALVKNTEQAAKVQEANAEKSAKAIGERLMEESKEESSEEVEKMKAAAKKTSAAIEKAAKEHMEDGINSVVEFVWQRMGNLSKS